MKQRRRDDGRGAAWDRPDFSAQICSYPQFEQRPRLLFAKVNRVQTLVVESTGTSSKLRHGRAGEDKKERKAQSVPDVIRRKASDGDCAWPTRKNVER